MAETFSLESRVAASRILLQTAESWCSAERATRLAERRGFHGLVATVIEADLARPGLQPWRRAVALGGHVGLRKPIELFYVSYTIDSR